MTNSKHEITDKVTNTLMEILTTSEVKGHSVTVPDRLKASELLLQFVMVKDLLT